MRNRIEKSKEKLCEDRGDILVSMYIKVMCAVLIVLFALEFFGLVLYKQDIDYIGRQITSQIEREGYVSRDIDTYIKELNKTLNTNATYTISANYTNGSKGNKCIQFNEEFKVTIKDSYKWRAVKLPETPITSIYSGRSEVYWK